MENLLQLNFSFQGPGHIYQQLVSVLAHTVTNAPGLIWKTWLINEATAEAGGIYLFHDETSLQHFLQGDLERKLKAQQGVCNLSIKTFHTLNEIPLVALTRWKT